MNTILIIYRNIFEYLKLKKSSQKVHFYYVVMIMKYEIIKKYNI